MNSEYDNENFFNEYAKMSASFDLALNTELGMEYIEECVQKAL